MKRTREEWIAAAKATLITQGVDAVRVDRLARDLGVTRGSFYGYFAGRDKLLSELIEVWRQQNTTPLHEAIEAAAPDGAAQVRAVMELWISEETFSPPFDSAVRDWARTSPEVAEIVQAIDDERIDALIDPFRNLGCPPKEAMIRARVMYYHQVGYYAMGVVEDEVERRKLTSTYLHVLTGQDIF